MNRTDTDDFPPIFKEGIGDKAAEAFEKLGEAAAAAGKSIEEFMLAGKVKIRAESGKELRRQRRAEARANAKRPKTPNYTEFAFNTLKARRAADPTFRNIRNENGEHV